MSERSPVGYRDQHCWCSTSFILTFCIIMNIDYKISKKPRRLFRDPHWMDLLFTTFFIRTSKIWLSLSVLIILVLFWCLRLNLFLICSYYKNIITTTTTKNEFWTLNMHVKQNIYVSISSPVTSRLKSTSLQGGH